MGKTTLYCPNKHTDCFACVEGRCSVLSNTNFEGRDCPFFKTREQCQEENALRKERLRDLGLTHYFDKYGR